VLAQAERHRGEDSPWAPWIALLPEAGAPGALGLPLFWDQEDVAVLEGCSTRPIAELNLEVWKWNQYRIFWGRKMGAFLIDKRGHCFLIFCGNEFISRCFFQSIFHPYFLCFFP